MAIVPKLKIGGAGPFRRDHAGAYRVFRVTDSAKEGTLGRNQKAAENFSATASGWFTAGGDSDLESLGCIKGSVHFAESKAAPGKDAKTPPFCVSRPQRPCS